MSSFKLPPGIYRMKNPKSRTYVACSSERWGIIHGWESDELDDHQKWEFEAVGEGYRIRNLGNGMFMTRSGGEPIQASPNPTLWKLSRLPNGALCIWTGDRCIDIDWGNRNNGTNINLLPKRNVIEQMWRLKPVNSQALDVALKSLEDTRQRLVAVEEKVATAEKAVTEMQLRLSTNHALATADGCQLSKSVGHQPPANAATTASVNEMFDHTRDQLVAMRESIKVTGDRVDRLNCNTVVLQTTVDKLQVSFGQNQDRLSAVEGTMEQLGSQGGPRSRKGADESDAKQPSPPVYSEGYLGQPDSHILSPASTQQLGGHRFTVLEARLGKLEGSFVQSQAYLSSVQTFLRTIEHKMPTMELKIGKLGVSHGQMKEEMSAARISRVVTEERLASLDERTQDIESRVDSLTGSLEEIQTVAGDNGHWPTAPLLPTTFHNDGQLNSR